MSISVVKRNYIVQAAVLTLLCVLSSSICFYYLPDYYFGGYSLIPVFFFAFGIFTINMTEMSHKHSPQRVSQVYLLMRGIRMVLSLVIMVLYCFIIGQKMGAFLAVFIVNYLIYLVFDSWFFFRYERRTVNRNKEK